MVFSGGKFELRKGQDVVIRAYRVLEDRHPDVMLVNAWFNPWPDVFVKGSVLLLLFTSFSNERQLFYREATVSFNDQCP